MSLQTNTVTRDNIFYYSSSGFYVQIEDGAHQHQHPCAESSWLHFLLTYVQPDGPLLTKKGEASKRQPPPHKDQAWHFYTAQLHHYGLKAVKDKAAAKKRLLAAFGDFNTLAVPSEVGKIRDELRQLYKRGNAKPQKKEKEEEKKPEASQKKKEALPTSKKRKAEESLPDAPETKKKSKGKSKEEPETSKKTDKAAAKSRTKAAAKTASSSSTVSLPAVPVGTVITTPDGTQMVAINSGDPANPIQFRKLATEEEPKKKASKKADKVDVKAPATKIKVKAEVEEKPPQRRRTKLTAKKSGPSIKPPSTQQTDEAEQDTIVGNMAMMKPFDVEAWNTSSMPVAEAGPSNDTKGHERKKQTARKSTGGKAPVRRLIPSKAAARRDPSPKPSGPKLPPRETEGYFEITAPYISDNWGDEDDPDTMFLCMSPSSGTQEHLWISFDFGIVSGVMRGKAPPKIVNSACKFEWRGHEAGEGEMTFNDGNQGEVTFLGNGKIQGKISGSFLGENVEFFGEKVPEPNVVWSKSVEQWKKTFRGINSHAYERANAARWGKWVSDEGCNEDPADSDTTVGGQGYDSELYDVDEEDEEMDGY